MNRRTLERFDDLLAEHGLQLSGTVLGGNDHMWGGNWSADGEGDVFVFAKGSGPDVFFDPPRVYELDITREVRAWSRGEKTPHGLAVRIVPNRGVDDGWTVRFSPAKDKPVELKIETFAD